MNPIEQLKTMHGEAKDRLSKHPDYILMRSLETLIENLEGHTPEWEGAEATENSETVALADEPEAAPQEDVGEAELEVEATSDAASSMSDWNQALSGDSAKDLEGELAQDLEIELAADLGEPETVSEEAAIEPPVSNVANG